MPERPGDPPSHNRVLTDREGAEGAWLREITRKAPPLPEARPPFPSEPPWSACAADLAHLWLRVRCDCGAASAIPLRYLAATRGWQRPCRRSSRAFAAGNASSGPRPSSWPKMRPSAGAVQNQGERTAYGWCEVRQGPDRRIGLRHVRSLYPHERPTGDPRPRRRDARRVGQPAALPRHLPGLLGPDRRNAPDGVHELSKARWGMPSSQKAMLDAAMVRARKLEAKGKRVDFKELLRMEPDGGTTNIRNTASPHWKRWLEPANRCVVPFTSFSEFNRDAGGDIWFALSEERPLAFFAGIWTTWTSVRKVREGEVTADLFGFLTTTPNNVVAPIHPKAMPVVLTTGEQIETWLTAPISTALELQRRLLDNTLQIVARGKKEDGPDGR